MTKSRWASWAAVAGGLLLTLFINYHSYLANFNLVPGDRGDTRLVVFTLEHWFSALGGHEAPLQLNMFYPDRLALGFADGLVLFGVPYAVFRLAGTDYFTSYQLTLVVLSAFGYAMYLLPLHRVLKLRLGLAVVGAVLLTSLNSMQLQIDIGKLLAFYFWPLLILLLYWYATQPDHATVKARAFLPGFSVLLGLLFLTSYYPAWYFVFSLILFGVVYFGVSTLGLGFRQAARRTWVWVAARRLDLAMSVIVFIVALIPFGLTYAPLILSKAARSFPLVLDFTPTVRDIVNVSPQNYAWSGILRSLHFDFGNREVQMGSPLLILVLFVVTYIRQLAAAIRHSFSGTTADRLMFALGTTAILVGALTVKVRGLSAWYLVYTLVPGATALRAEGRFLIVMDMIVVVAVMYGLNKLLEGDKTAATGSPRAGVVAGIVLACGLMIAEQVNGTSFRLDKAEQLAFIDSFPKPPAGCQAFFISNPRETDLPIGYYQLDAMMVSMKQGLATVNGYSGISPDPAFSMVPAGVEYEYDVLDWLRANQATTGICRLDYQTRSYSTVDVNADYARYLQQVRDDFLARYRALFEGVKGFVQGGNDLSNLYPQYLEEHGYVDSSLGFQTGAQYHWIGDKYWIGARPCGKSQCPAIGIVGSYIEIQDIIEGFGAGSSQVFFPFPSEYDPRTAVGSDVSGELLIVFPKNAFAQ